MQHARKYTVVTLMLMACGSVVCQPQQRCECRVVLRELQLCVERFQRQHRVSPKLDNALKLKDPEAFQPCHLAKHENESTVLVDSSNAQYQVKLTLNQMRRLANLFSNVVSIDNVARAFEAAKKGKKNYKEVKMIEADKDHYLNKLHELLRDGNFQPSKYIIFHRYNGHKLRKIYRLPFYPDRLVHHCIVHVLEPIWMDVLIRDTYSTIKKRGIHDGMRRIERSLNDREGTKYCLKLDVRQFYPSVDHDILKSLIRQKIKDQRVLSLWDSIIESAPGLPIGNYISQWFGNMYLAYFDHFVKEELKVKYYFRYCDDIVLLSDNKESLWTDFSQIKRYLNDKLKLQVKSNYQIFPVHARGIDFLGYRFFHDHTLVRKRIVAAFKDKIRTACDEKHLQASAMSYYGWFVHANSKGLIHKYFDDETKLLRASTCAG